LGSQMAERKRGMGRGLAAILPETSAGGPELRELAVGEIEPNPDQPRATFDAAALDALAGSIGSVGLLQPLIVRPIAEDRYELVAGERRWRAAQKAGLDRVPAVIRSSPEDERLQAALIENMVREDLNPVEEARACAALVDDLGISKEELARRVGRSRAAISNLIRLLDLPDTVLGLLERGDLTEGHGRAILQVRDQDARSKLAKRAAAEGWSVRETERHADHGGGRRKKATSGGRISAEERAAMSGAEDLLGAALGQDVRVRRAGDGVKAELLFDDLTELESLAKRLRKRS
jgi:ParB family chromosome partitioning protein